MAPFDLSAWQAELEAISGTLLDFCWQGLLVMLAYAAARGIWRSDPGARLRAGYLALLALAAAPAITLTLRWPSGGSAGVAAQINGPLDLMVVSGGAAPINWTPWLVALWAIGVLLMAARAGWQWRSLSRICASAEPLDARWQHRLAELGQRFGLARSLTVLESAQIGSPSLIGWLKPVILLPAGLVLRLPSAQVELVLAHEIAHLRRNDHLANLLQVLLETALFYHPAVHWISRKVREDREQCCDDLVATVCDARLDYARALLSIAEQGSTLPRLAIAAGGGQLLARVERIVGADRAPPRRLNERWMLAVAAALVLLFGLQVLPGDDAQSPTDWPTSLLRLDRVPTPLLGLRIGDLSTGRPQPPRYLPAIAAEQTAPPAAVETDPEALNPGADSAPPLALDRIALDRITLDRIALDRIALAPPAPALLIDASAIAVPLSAPDIATSLPAAVSLLPLRVVEPVYPNRAKMQGIEGSVELSFAIDRDGRVSDVRIESADPAGMFEHAAERAVSRWRFSPQDAGGERHTQTFDFRLEGGELSNCSEPATGTRLCRRH